MRTYKSLALVLLCSASLTGCKPTSEKPAESTTSTRSRSHGAVHVTSAAQFDQLIANGNVLVDFYASWCGPCKRLGPVIDQLAQEIDTVTFLKVDTDQLNSISNRYGIRSIPTLLFFKNGAQVKREQGYKSASELRNLLSSTF
jgi:thioredoxin